MRRRLLIAAILAAPHPAVSQQQGSAFRGSWVGDVPGIGPTRLIIFNVRPDGQVEGRMEFELRSYVSTFGDKADSAANTNHGSVQGSVLVIESALGGRYELAREGNALAGTYTRGTTYQVAVRFAPL